MAGASSPQQTFWVSWLCNLVSWTVWSFPWVRNRDENGLLVSLFCLLSVYFKVAFSKWLFRLHCFHQMLLLLSRFSCVRLCATPAMAAHQAAPSLGFSRQEHWSGLPFPSPMHESEKWKWSRSVLSDSSQPHGLQPTRLLRPWDFPGKSTGVGCHCLLWFLCITDE